MENSHICRHVQELTTEVTQKVVALTTTKDKLWLPKEDVATEDQCKAEAPREGGSFQARAMGFLLRKVQAEWGDSSHKGNNHRNPK